MKVLKLAVLSCLTLLLLSQVSYAQSSDRAASKQIAQSVCDCLEKENVSSQENFNQVFPECSNVAVQTAITSGLKFKGEIDPQTVVARIEKIIQKGLKKGVKTYAKSIGQKIQFSITTNVDVKTS